MIIGIHDVGSVPGSKRITFTAITDADGAQETISTIINGRYYGTQVNVVGPGAHGLSITHNESGPHTVVLRAEISGVSSNPTVIWG